MVSSKVNRRPTPKKAKNEGFEFPSNLNEAGQLFLNHWGDGFALAVCVLVAAYFMPLTTPLAEMIIVINHNVTNPADLKQHEWVEFVPGVLDVPFIVFAVAVTAAVQDLIGDLIFYNLNRQMQPKLSWQLVGSTMVVRFLILIGAATCLSDTWKPDGVGYAWLNNDTSERASLGIKLMALLCIVSPLTTLTITTIQKMTSKSKNFNMTIVLSSVCLAAGGALTHFAGFDRLQAAVIVALYAGAVFFALAELMQHLAVRKSNKLASNVVGTAEIAASLQKAKVPMQLAGVAAAGLMTAYTLLVAGPLTTNGLIAGAGIALSAVGLLIPCTMPTITFDGKTY
ncbi:uncharacterized protein MONBRDRAFT_29341 [Monosiga brevicollis MX1]|uniref:Uncharacterized protein n=1 Tax=Monosiga brevicollis TaxID=81824 RepID=A9VAT9_MONBE|nr:uncharacterized protein MONBRDRAFT_29341 [Monosiga brevicollis MX1]EDQ85434.1 predicted protein [Monosiga brevicollis MX1]|eukprot:XP_001749845.1 hypothetical protein [Monosiga brevicollis MX1]